MKWYGFFTCEIVSMPRFDLHTVFIFLLMVLIIFQVDLINRDSILIFPVYNMGVREHGV